MRPKTSFLRKFAVQSIMLVAFVLCFFQIPGSAVPSSLSPRGTKYEQHIAKRYNNWWLRTVAALGREGVLFREPVHEEITNRIYGCDDDQSICGDPEVEFAGPFILGGVRWNDDPPFQLHAGEGKHTVCKTTETIRFTTQPVCWLQIFRAAKARSATGDVPDAYNHAPLLARSHFGDLQFFHAMASRDGELPAETQKRILMWAEFTWKVATDEYGLDTKLKDVDIAEFDDFFGNSGWAVQDLFTVGNRALREHIEDVAFGSNLHAVEDSFANGHVEREENAPGVSCAGLPQLAAPRRIIEFHSYAHQDEKKHAEADARDAFAHEMSTDTPNEIVIGRALREFRKNGAKWETVKPYYACIFGLADSTTPASPGKDFAMEDVP